MDDDRLVVTSSVKIPRHELVVRFSTSGGPGGQHANKTATRAELTFDVEASGAFTDDATRPRAIEARPGDPRRRRRRALPTSQPRPRRRTARRASPRRTPRRSSPPVDPPDPRIAAAPDRRQEATRRDQARPPAPFDRRRLNPNRTPITVCVRISARQSSEILTQTRIGPSDGLGRMGPRTRGQARASMAVAPRASATAGLACSPPTVFKPWTIDGSRRAAPIAPCSATSNWYGSVAFVKA